MNIKSKRRIAIIISCLVAVMVGMYFAIDSFTSRPRLNVLLVTLDTTRADRLGCYGYKEAVTPNLDGLAGRGAMFERAFAPAPQTLVSHATMLTGLNPPEHGLRINGAAALDASIPTLTSILEQQGYQTAAFVAASVLDSTCGLDQGFQTYDDDLTQGEKSRTKDLQVRSGRQIVDAAMAWLRPRQTRPFFCWCHFFDPHVPRQTHPQEFGDVFRNRAYDAEIAYVDVEVGRLLKFLRQHGLEQQTLVIVVGDHGEGLGEHGEDEHGYMVYNSTLRVPLMLSCPAIIPSGVQSAELVSLVDLLPTVLDCVQLPIPEELSGRSLSPALRSNPLKAASCYGETDAPFWEAGWSPLRSLITDQWKYIRTTRPELFDLSQDPDEQHNLAEKLPDQLQHMEQLLSEFEGQMVRREGKPVASSTESQRALRSLGYSGGGTATADTTSGEIRRDIKDTIAYPIMVRNSFSLVEQGQLDQAERMLTEVLTAVPDYAQAHAALGACRSRQERNDEAVEHLQRALELAPEHTNLVWVSAALGKVRLSQQKYELALVHFSEALARDPAAADLHILMGVAYGNLGQVQDARKHFEAARNIDPMLAAAEERLGDLCAQQQEFVEARQHYEAALRQHPELFETRERLAEIQVELGSISDAIRHYDELLRSQPGNANVLVALSLLFSTSSLAEHRNGPRSLELANRACQVTANREPVALDALAAAYAELGKFHKAVAIAERAQQLAQDAERAELAEDIAERLLEYREERPVRVKPSRLPQSSGP